MSEGLNQTSSFTSEGLFPINSSSDDGSLEEHSDSTEKGNLNQQQGGSKSQILENGQEKIIDLNQDPDNTFQKSKSAVQSQIRSANFSQNSSQNSSPFAYTGDVFLNKSRVLFEKYKHSSPFKKNRSPNLFQCKLQRIAAKLKNQGILSQSQENSSNSINKTDILINARNVNKNLHCSEQKSQEELIKTLDLLVQKLNKINKQQSVIKQSIEKIKEKKKQISEQVQHKYILAQQNIIFQKQQIQNQINQIQSQIQMNIQETPRQNVEKTKTNGNHIHCISRKMLLKKEIEINQQEESLAKDPPIQSIVNEFEQNQTNESLFIITYRNNILNKILFGVMCFLLFTIYQILCRALNS